MLSSLGSFFGDGRAAPVLAAVVGIIVIAGVAFGIYRFAFARRLRPPGAARGRAPRLGVVDVFGLDGQRQLVIVRRDNVEHLLLLGGPNDIVIEPNIMRSAANGRDASKSGASSEPPSEPAAPATAPAAPPPRAAPQRRELPVRMAPAESPAPVEPVIVLAESRPRPTPAPRPASEPPKAEPVKVEPVKPEAAKAIPAPEPPKPAVGTETPKPVETQAKPVEPAPVVEPAMKSPIDTPRRTPAPPRPAPVSVRAALPPPITPMRPRAAPEPNVEPVKPVASGELVTLKPVAPVTPAPTVSNAPPVEAPAKPAGDLPQNPGKSKKEDTFYDLESLEAEMARLLGRDP
jgi:flagellar protein FliO/FliZ